VLLLLLGGALVRIAADGVCLRYIKPGLRPWLLVAGVVIVLLAGLALWRDLRPRSGDDGHWHQHGFRSTWLLVVPVLAIFLVAPPALGADSVLRFAGHAAGPARPSALPPLPSGAVVSLGLSEFVTRAVWDTSDSLRGRTVRLTGFVVHGPGGVYLARLVITCCAADATPMRVLLVGAAGAALPDNQWVQVDGRPRIGSATRGDDYTPVLDTSAVVPIAASADPYEY
jgi:uncharacterized repeat protein (TIGR03943 family)